MEDDKLIPESDKDMFTNWCQSSSCLEKTKIAFHNRVIKKWKELLQGYNVSTMRRFLHDLSYATLHQTSKYTPKRLSMNCGHTDDCDEILKKLLQQERNPGCLVLNDEFRKYIQDLAKAPSDTSYENKFIWTLANMFMQPKKGQKAIITNGPEDTDVSPFFKMMNDCELFRFNGCDQLYENILEVRKEIHHSATYLFTKDQTLNCLKHMTRLLEVFPTDEFCCSAISKIKQIKNRKMIMASVSETEFKGIAKEALKLQEKSLVADIENDKVKGYTTDELNQKLKDTQERMKSIGGQSPRYGLQSRKELKMENQECKEKVKEMEGIKETMDKLRERTLELKSKIRQITDTNSSDTNSGGSQLVNKVQMMRASAAKRCLIDIVETFEKYDLH